MYRLQELRSSEHHSVTIFHTCFDKNSMDYNGSASDFTSLVLIIMLPGALNSLVLPVTMPFCFALWCLLLQALR